MVRHTQGNVPAVSQSSTERQHYRVHCVWSGFWFLFRVGVPHWLLATRFTPPPGPQPIVTGGKGVSSDMNTRRLGGGPHPSQAPDSQPLAPPVLIPKPLAPGTQAPLGEVKGCILRIQRGQVIQVDVTGAQVLASLQGA